MSLKKSFKHLEHNHLELCDRDHLNNQAVRRRRRKSFFEKMIIIKIIFIIKPKIIYNKKRSKNLEVSRMCLCSSLQYSRIDHTDLNNEKSKPQHFITSD